jgi:proteasome lid subunit RPN8/RPN11
VSLEPQVLADFKAHAVAEYPRECCGLAVVFKGRQIYVPCRNQAETPAEHFILHPEDYAAAEDRGEIIAVLHSHPNVPARASEGDRVSCEGSGLPWYIVSVMPSETEGQPPEPREVNSIVPEGYEAPLVNRPFVHGILDCYSLCRDWYKREHGLVLPDFERRDAWWNDGSSSLYEQHFAEAGFEVVTRTIKENLDVLRPGDGILMQIDARNQVPNHAAIYLGDGLMLHHLYNRLSSRDVYGGPWLDYTRAIVRHRNLK